MKFTKMHGAGNDYIYINGFEEFPLDVNKLAQQVSDRHFGIGADGLVMILPSEACDFRMRIFNADGSEAEMCGNASRCVGKYVYEKGLTDKTELTLETLAGVKHLSLSVVGGVVKSVTVDMGEPRLAPADIPVSLSGEEVVAEPIEACGYAFNMTCVSMGNPHAVIFVDDMEAFDLHKVGRAIETHPLFPRRTNVEFVKVLSRNLMQMRVWERGSGETLACGTGSCATLVAAVLNGLVERKAQIQLLGGELEIEWRADNNRVYMTGGAELVFEGEWIER